MRVTRDSAIWGLGIVGAAVTYLAASDPVTEWHYYDWLQAVAFAVATLSGKLATSPLAGDTQGRAADATEQTGDHR